jgi:ATP-binding cassette subfamily B protein
MLDWRNLAQTLQHRFRIQAYGHVQALDLAYFEDRSTGNLVSILNDDINQLERFLDSGANSLIQVAATVVFVGGIFFYLAPPVAVLAFVTIPVIVAGAFHFQKRAQPLYAGVRAQAGALASLLANNLSGIATIKSYASETHELRRVREESESYRERNAQAIRVSSAFIPLIRMAILAGFIATLLMGGYMTMNGKLAVGSYGVLVFLTQRLLWPLTSLACNCRKCRKYRRSPNAGARFLRLPGGFHLKSRTRCRAGQSRQTSAGHPARPVPRTRNQGLADGPPRRRPDPWHLRPAPD